MLKAQKRSNLSNGTLLALHQQGFSDRNTTRVLGFWTNESKFQLFSNNKHRFIRGEEKKWNIETYSTL